MALLLVISPISPAHLPCISPVSPGPTELDFMALLDAEIEKVLSRISPLHLPRISPTSPSHLPQVNSFSEGLRSALESQACRGSGWGLGLGFRAGARARARSRVRAISTDLLTLPPDPTLTPRP